MKCCLLAALMLAACGLDTGALPATDAGVEAAANGGGLAGSPATWPARRRLTPIAKNKDAGAADPANKPGGKQPSTSGTGGANGASGAGAQSKPTGQAGSAATGAMNPNGAMPGAQAPSNSGKGGQAKPNGQAGSGTSQPPGGNKGSQASSDAGTSSNGSSQGNPGSNGNSGAPGSGGQGPASGPGSTGNGNGPQSSSPVDDTVSAIVDLVLAILDLSLGPVRPVEIEQLVSAILVLSLAPAELAADSLVAVLDALDGTHICRDDPDRCNPLCQNLESDCSVCGKDEDCIDRVEEMCHVKLPRRCH